MAELRELPCVVIPMSTCFRNVRSIATPTTYVMSRTKSTWPPSLHWWKAKRMLNESSVTPSPCVFTTHTFDFERDGGLGNGRRGLYGIGRSVGRDDKGYSTATAGDSSIGSRAEGFMATYWSSSVRTECRRPLSTSITILQLTRKEGGTSLAVYPAEVNNGKSHFAISQLPAFFW